MNNNLNISKITKFLKNKNTVTALSAILIVIILLVGYNVRIKSQTKPVPVPVAINAIQPKTEITSDKVTLIEVPQSALRGTYYRNSQDVIGKYTNVNTVIPQGSLFYVGAVVDKSELPDSSLYEIKDDETLYYLTVNMLTSYTNSILPGNYIDIYISTKKNDRAFVGKLIKDVEVLAVKTSDGKNVFENSDESRVPTVVIFALPEEQHLLLRSVDAINNYAISSGNSAYSRIQIIPVPSTTNLTGSGDEIVPTVTSSEIEEYILGMATIVLEDKVPTDGPSVDVDVDIDNNNTEE